MATSVALASIVGGSSDFTLDRFPEVAVHGSLNVRHNGAAPHVRPRGKSTSSATSQSHLGPDNHRLTIDRVRIDLPAESVGGPKPSSRTRGSAARRRTCH